MCGIAGVAAFNGVASETLERRLDSAMTRLARRGPDGDGRWIAQCAAFVHRRLAVIALGEQGHQPMARDGLVITYNGEIFNYRELRQELEREGVRFQTQSDTEVLLAGWSRWKERLLPKLVGMFAFAIWDETAEEIVVVRDRYGEKPLVYFAANETLAFASDYLALEAVIGRTLPLNREALNWLFAVRYIPDPLTIGVGAYKLPPGHLLRFSRQGLRLSQWYDLAAAAAEVPASWPEAALLLRQTVDAAVAHRLVADVPVGVFLSGGIDSAIVASSVAASGARVRTFTVGFEGASDYYEERPAARTMAAHIGASHTEISVPAKFGPDLVDDVIAAMDEPFGDSSAVAQFVVSRETRRSVTVALSGDGADESFGGYRKYQGERLAELYGQLPEWLRRYVISPVAAALPEGKDSRVLERFRRLRRFVRHAGKPAAERQAGWNEEISSGELGELLNTSRPCLVSNRMRSLHDRFSAADALTRHLLTDISFGLPGDMLVKVDRMSMANALEVRSPFLDHRVIELAAALPGSWKVRSGQGKWILRRAFGDRLPPHILRLPKRGFEIPVASLLQGSLKEPLRAASDPARLARQGLFRGAPIQRWTEQLHRRSSDDSWKLWTFLVFQRWAQLHNRAEAV